MRRRMFFLLLGVIAAVPVFAVPINYHTKITDNLGMGSTDTIFTVGLRVWDAVSTGSLLAADIQDVVVTKCFFRSV